MWIVVLLGGAVALGLAPEGMQRRRSLVAAAFVLLVVAWVAVTRHLL